MKKCTKCGIKDRYSTSGFCKDCKKEYARDHYLKNRERNLTYASNYRKKNRDEMEKRRRTKRYNLEANWYEDKIKEQEFRCAGCLTHQKDLEYALCVDHCHTTEKPRGLLCRPCNLALGNSKDDPDTLRRLAEYAEETRETTEREDRSPQEGQQGSQRAA